MLKVVSAAISIQRYVAIYDFLVSLKVMNYALIGAVRVT